MKHPYSELKLSGQATGEPPQNPSTRPNGVYETRGDSVMGWHPLVGTETRRRPILSLGARGAAVGFLVVDPVKKRGSGGVLDLKVVTPFEVIPVRKVDVINATSSGPSVIYGC